MEATIFKSGLNRLISVQYRNTHENLNSINYVCLYIINVNHNADAKNNYFETGGVVGWCLLFNLYLDVSASDFETHVPGSTLTEALRFRQEGHPELKCNMTPIKSSSKIWWSGRQPCY